MVSGKRATNLSEIQAVMDYIHNHPWDDLSLNGLSQLITLSPHYFHRVFKTEVGENLYDFIRRVRIDKAARHLIFNEKTITEIADECGFQSLVSFSRTFKQLRGVPPSTFRDRHRISSSLQNRSAAVKRFQRRMVDPVSKEPVHGVDKVIAWAMQIIQETRINHLPDYQVINYKHKGVLLDQINHSMVELFSDLYREANRLHLASNSSKMLLLSYDDPFITENSKCRYEICMTVERKPTRLSQQMGTKRISGGKYATLSIAEIPTIASLLGELVVQEWLPQSGYGLDFDRPAMEVYAHSPEQDPFNRHVFDLYIPIRAQHYL